MVASAAPAGSEIVAEDGEHQAGLKWNRMIEKKHVIGVERWSAGNYGLGKSDRRDEGEVDRQRVRHLFISASLFNG